MKTALAIAKPFTSADIIRQELRGKAGTCIAVGLLFLLPAFLLVPLMYLVGATVPPLILWFIPRLPEWSGPVCGMGFVAALFLTASRTDHVYWTQMTYDSQTRGEIPLSQAGCRLGYRGFRLPADMIMGPNSMRMIVKMLSLPLLAGPGLVLSAMRCFREAHYLRSLDTEWLGLMVDLMWREGRHLSFAELRELLPEFDPDADVKALSQIDGILVLHKEPGGLALSDELEARLDALADATPRPG